MSRSPAGGVKVGSSCASHFDRVYYCNLVDLGGHGMYVWFQVLNCAATRCLVSLNIVCIKINTSEYVQYCCTIDRQTDRRKLLSVFDCRRHPAAVFDGERINLNGLYQVRKWFQIGRGQGLLVLLQVTSNLLVLIRYTWRTSRLEWIAKAKARSCYSKKSTRRLSPDSCHYSARCTRFGPLPFLYPCGPSAREGSGIHTVDPQRWNGEVREPPPAAGAVDGSAGGTLLKEGNTTDSDAGDALSGRHPVNTA